MGRGKVKLQRIDDGARRMSSFSKRRNGLLKKARELAVLCDAEVAILVFTPKGKLSSFSSHSCLERTFERYRRFTDAERKVKDNVPGQKSKRVEFAACEENHGLGVQQTFLDNLCDEKDMTDLNKLQEKLESELKKIMSRKRALLKNAGVNFPQSIRVMDVERESPDEEEEPCNGHRVHDCSDCKSGSSGC